MTQIGEGISVALARLDKGECIFCGKPQHENKKEERIEPTGWKRPKSGAFKGVGGNFRDTKLDLYPDKESPPNSTYRSEGHHCLAFSAFIANAKSDPHDRYAVLNYYLQKDGYDPSNSNNCIDLPGRKEKNDMDEHAQYKEFEKAVVAGYPLQLHIGGHVEPFMMQSYMMIRDLINSSKRRKFCEKPDDEFKKKLKQKIAEKEDIAFKKTANKDPAWIAHPGPLAKAERYVMEKRGYTEITYPKI